MNKSIIPPSPSKSDYTKSASYTDVAEANAVEIFDRTDPLALFSEWMTDARGAEPNDSNAMSLATVDAEGFPDVRMVLLKGIDERGFTFYTNANSAKGQQLKTQAKAALCFHWKSLRRQVRVRGSVIAVKGQEADDYFASRARGSKLGAWSSDQSRPVASRATLEAKVSEAESRFENREISRPEFWHGWRVEPVQIEFWRDRPFRLHDRLLFSRADKNQSWTTGRLFP
ncbi:MAG: pyridoxamine 5'-phosphate oxidase [Maricaulaceae bacterium]